LKKTVLFDLGNTLAQYYDLSEFPAILEQGISNVADYLESLGISTIPKSDLSERVRQENHESKDFQVRPLEDRLARIFQLDSASDSYSELSMTICRQFMKPIFALGHLYDDALPTMKDLRSESYSIGIVSNTSWGSPASLWREEIGRLGLEKLVDTSVFCRDVGWRKPDSRIFTSALQELGVSVDESVFVGDEPRWDVVGPNSIGMEAIVIDRQGRFKDEHPDAIHSLLELPSRLRKDQSVGEFLNGF
jgi:putative hydrolase of the HAD superfamily